VNTINQGTQAKILFPKLALPAKQQLVKVRYVSDEDRFLISLETSTQSLMHPSSRADAMAKFLGF